MSVLSQKSLVLLSVYLFVLAAARHGWTFKRPVSTLLSIRPELRVRCGHEEEQDEERYSRQVYTLGARAHGLIRSTTVYIDGPPASGLVYETAKNLALSGVRRIVLLRSDSFIDQNYFDERLDDLGQAYRRAARAEVDVDGHKSDEQVLMEYIQRLNPSVQVTVVDRGSLDLMSTTNVLMAIDRPYGTQLELNRLSRQLAVPMISVETAGVYGRLFCDFGDDFEVYDADGETPLVTPFLECVDEDGSIVVRSIDGEKHDVSKGDKVAFQLRDGSLANQTCTVVNVRTPFEFTVEFDGDGATAESLDLVNRQAASFQRIKVTQHLAFSPLEETVESAKTDASLFTPSDLDKSFDTVRRSATFSAFQALGAFVEKQGRLPTVADAEEFKMMAQNSWNLDDDCKEDAEKHIMSFVRGCAAKLSPLEAVYGAIAAQEALKAATGLYNPTRQFLLYDCDEVMADMEDAKSVDEVSDSSAPGLRYILGHATVDELQSMKIFVVGAGAIGCELIKNLASMGVGTGKGGRISLTDVDTIEKSNLSRQLLFRDNDIGKFKSAAAHEGALRFNEAVVVESHSSRVGGHDAGPFDESFWSNRVDVVLNALDNMEARLYMDRQCVANEKALVDAGTMGPKGNVQVVVPHQSESYSSSVDPPEQAIPVCTLKNFPYAISHTIQWGRDLFDGLFERRPTQANNFIRALAEGSLEDEISAMLSTKGDASAIETAKELAEDLKLAAAAMQASDQSIREDSLHWASMLAYKLFFQTAQELRVEHPADSLDEDGEPFWSGTRRPPQPLAYSGSSLHHPQTQQSRVDDNMIEFVRAASRLRVESAPNDVSCSSFFSPEEIDAALKEVYEKASSLENDELPNMDVAGDDKPLSKRMMQLLGDAEVGSELAPIEFEKDDESNDHVAFVNAASNLRAISYGIPPVDAMETRRVAGNIVPAMITTTAFVSALSCIELIKLAGSLPLVRHRNAFVNLALPFFAFTMPLPAEELPGLNGKSYTLWDRLDVAEDQESAESGGLTMRSLLRKIQQQAADEAECVHVSSVSCGPYMLFADFLHDDDDEVLDSPIWTLLEQATASVDEFESDSSREPDETEINVDFKDYVDLLVVVEDNEHGDEVELPVVRVRRYKSS